MREHVSNHAPYAAQDSDSPNPRQRSGILQRRNLKI
jgi:hypothetical protein